MLGILPYRYNLSICLFRGLDLAVKYKANSYYILQKNVFLIKENWQKKNLINSYQLYNIDIAFYKINVYIRNCYRKLQMHLVNKLHTNWDSTRDNLFIIKDQWRFIDSLVNIISYQSLNAWFPLFECNILYA